MDPLEIKAEPPELVVNIFQSFTDNEINDENQEYGDDPLAVEIEQAEYVRNNFQHFGKNGCKIENGNENGDFSSELTLLSVSVFCCC